MTLLEMRQEVGDNLELEGLKVPSSERILRALNRAKDDMAARLENLEPFRFLARADQAIGAGVLSVALPASYRRITGVARVDASGDETDIEVRDRRDLSVKDTSAGFWMYREGENLYFNTTAGAPDAMTIRVRYVVKTPDLTSADAAATFTYLPDDWTDLLMLQATVDLMPGGHAGRVKYELRKAERLELMSRSQKRQTNTGPMTVRVCNDEGY